MIPSRLKRVEELVKEQVALIIQREMKDPRLKFTTVTDVNVTKDLRNANVYVIVHNETEGHISEVLEALNSASGFIRHSLGQRVVLRYLPSLEFFYDDSFSKAQKIDTLIHQIRAERDEE